CMGPGFESQRDHDKIENLLIQNELAGFFCFSQDSLADTFYKILLGIFSRKLDLITDSQFLRIHFYDYSKIEDEFLLHLRLIERSFCLQACLYRFSLSKHGAGLLLSAFENLLGILNFC